MVSHSSDPNGRPGRGQALAATGRERLAKERVARALARAGVASRRDAERLIEAGRAGPCGW